ncbi:MAG: Holliday junction branch migration protein RuvA [Gammaproteobacteria bacterium]|nr:MAG: Holliday junction branch migration protein RuvA [Gammaproteobacteria bacterium]
MIGRLRGTLLEKNPPALLLDVNGVGYEVDVPMSTFYELPATGEAVTLVTHLVVREDAQLLYGFGHERERAMFRALLKVNGVGAKVALSILSGLSVDELVRAVHDKDSAALVRIPGIGRKTAERLLVELQDRVDMPAALPDSDSATGALDARAADSVRDQAEEALLALGYKATEIRRLLDKVAAEGQSVEEMIRAALRAVVRK